MKSAAPIAAFLGASMLVFGVRQFSTAAGWIAAGVIVLVAALALAYLRGES